jgi:5-methylcytosine-specific restriction endonuclease McrA
MPRLYPLPQIGDRFARVIVLAIVVPDGVGRIHARCQCDCGAVFEVQPYRLTKGHSKSCGCLRREKKVGIGISSYDPINRTKICACCHELKSIDQFGPASRPTRRDPFSPYCGQCCVKKTRERLLRDPLAREKQRANRRLHRNTPRGRMRARIDAAIRRARQIEAGGNFTADDISRIFMQQKGKCAICRCKLGDKFHIDHIVPICAGGTSFPSNLQIACPPCNHRKSGKDPIAFMQSRGFLL